MGDYVIVLCPCCASTTEAAEDDREQCFTCLTCGQTWVMLVDAERHRTHALS